jgi:hypothetical protein
MKLMMNKNGVSLSFGKMCTEDKYLENTKEYVIFDENGKKIKKQLFFESLKNKSYINLDDNTLDKMLNMYNTNRLHQTKTLSDVEIKRIY